MKKTYAFLFSCFIFFSVLFVHFILSYRIQTEIKYREDDKIIYAKDKFKAQVLKSFEQQAELLHFFSFQGFTSGSSRPDFIKDNSYHRFLLLIGEIDSKKPSKVRLIYKLEGQEYLELHLIKQIQWFETAGVSNGLKSTILAAGSSKPLLLFGLRIPKTSRIVFSMIDVKLFLSELGLVNAQLAMGPKVGKEDQSNESYEDLSNPKTQWQQTGFDFAGKNWELKYPTDQNTRAQFLDYVPQGFVLFGVINSFLLATLMWSLLTTRWMSEQKESSMLKKIESKNEELTAILNSFPGMVSWVNKDLHYVGVNKELASSFQRKPEDFVGQEIGFLSTQDPGNEPFKKIITDFFQGLQPRQIIHYSFSTERGEHHFMTTLQKYWNNEMAMVVSIDISEQKRLEKQVEETKVKALNSSRMSALGEMAGGMAHEINNPLTIIYAKASLLKRALLMKKGEVDLPWAIESLEKIEATADRISKIIKGLRTIARDGEGDPFQPARVQNLVADLVELCKYRMASKSIEFRFPKDIQAHWDLDCRSTQIVQVLLNLINNSYDAIQKNQEKWIELNVSVNSDTVEFSVTDSGTGIPEKIREKMMQPFFTTKEIGKGTGLGLSISKGIVESHKGQFYVDTQSPNTRFVMKLPRYQIKIPKAA